MRTRLRFLPPSVLALTFVALLVAPLTALAQSHAISMYPETAGPGSTVEINGVGFPPDRVVEVQLSTPDGTVALTTATAGLDGDFRQVLALPLGVSEGVWELRANAADGSISTYGFVTSPEMATEAALLAAMPIEAAAPTGNTSGDIALMLVIAVVLGGLAFGAIVVFRQIRDESPPGMGKGDDLIWGGGKADKPERTATEEPHWKAAEATPAAPATQAAQSDG